MTKMTAGEMDLSMLHGQRSELSSSQPVTESNDFSILGLPSPLPIKDLFLFLFYFFWDRASCAGGVSNMNYDF